MPPFPAHRKASRANGRKGGAPRRQTTFDDIPDDVKAIILKYTREAARVAIGSTDGAWARAVRALSAARRAYLNGVHRLGMRRDGLRVCMNMLKAHAQRRAKACARRMRERLRMRESGWMVGRRVALDWLGDHPWLEEEVCGVVTRVGERVRVMLDEPRGANYLGMASLSHWFAWGEVRVLSESTAIVPVSVQRRAVRAPEPVYVPDWS